MSHLTDEQFEDVIQGRMPEPEHLRGCEQCQQHLTEARVVRERLQKAFGSLQASPDLAARIKGLVQREPENTTKGVRLRFPRRVWSSLVAAAAVVLFAVPVSLFMNTSSQARASQEALIGIHHLSLDHPDKLFHDDDPNRMADHMEDLTGQRLVMVQAPEGWVICGSRSCSFKGRKVPTYMVETAAGRVSVVVLKETPKQLGMKHKANLNCWTATCKCCSMAAVRLGDDTYYALGDVTHEVLSNVLSRLVP
ncbi:hypothetical protein ACFL6U_01935 [Planctomycetota bacterium]